MTLCKIFTFSAVVAVVSAIASFTPVKAATMTEPGTIYKILEYTLSYNPDSCMSDFYAGVLNHCPGTQTVLYPLPMSTSGTKTITVHSIPLYFKTGLACTAYEVDVNNGILISKTITFSAAGQDKSLTIPFVAGSTDIELKCTIPVNAGIMSVTWTN